MPSSSRLKFAPQQVDWAILTPLGAEYEAVSSGLEEAHDVGNSVFPVRQGVIGGHKVICALCGKGEANSGVALQHLFEGWSPRWVVLSGIAGAVEGSKVTIGDVVIANFIYSLDFGKVTKGKFLRRPEYDFPSDRSLLAYVDAFLAKPNKWRDSIPIARPDGRPHEATQAHIGYVASSDKVVDDQDSDFFKAMRASVPEIHAIEMEAVGVCASIRLEQGRRSVGFLMVRGISDEPQKLGLPGSDQRAAWKGYASAGSATFVIHFIRSYPRSEAIDPAPIFDRYFDHRCKPCSGRGHYGDKPSNTCKICQGKGHLLIEGPRHLYQRCRPCAGCGYYGNNPRQTCKVCSGLGIIIKPAVANGR